MVRFVYGCMTAETNNLLPFVSAIFDSYYISDTSSSIMSTTSSDCYRPVTPAPCLPICQPVCSEVLMWLGLHTKWILLHGSVRAFLVNFLQNYFWSTCWMVRIFYYWTLLIACSQLPACPVPKLLGCLHSELIMALISRANTDMRDQWHFVQAPTVSLQSIWQLTITQSFAVFNSSMYTRRR